jgi:hypothetical protein
MTELTALNFSGVVDVSLDGGFREVRLAEQDLKVEIGLVLSSSKSQLKDPREVDVASAIVLSDRSRTAHTDQSRPTVFHRAVLALTDVSTKIRWTPDRVKFCRPITTSRMNRLKHVTVAGCGSNVVT